MSQTDNDDAWFPITPFAVRLKGEEGWIVDEAPLALPEIEQNLRAKGGQIEDLRKITGGVGRRRDDAGDPVLSGSDLARALGWGWTYDEVAACWRAPGENVLPFGGKPTTVETLNVTYGEPHAGWLPFTFAAEAQTCSLVFSHIYCPFEDFVAWLEVIASGGAGRFSVDLEGYFVEFFGFEAGQPDRVRVVLALDHCCDEDRLRDVQLNIDVDRQALVKSIYGSLRAYALSPDFNSYEWAHISLRDDLRRKFPDVSIGDLARLGRREVNDILWQLYPSHTVSFSTATTKAEETKKFVAWVRSDLERRPGDMTETPSPWFEVSEDFDPSSLENRLEMLEALFGESATSWHGADLRLLRSEKIERWLGET